MKHVGWFVWTDYNFHGADHKNYEFVSEQVEASLEVDGKWVEVGSEKYADYLAKRYLREGQYGFKIKKSGYVKAFAEESNG
jgi:hypothetical protein